MKMPGLPKPDTPGVAGPTNGKLLNETPDALDSTRLECLAEPYRRYRLERAAKAILRGLLLPHDYLPRRLKPEVDSSPLLKWPGEFGILRKV